jgi:hypothetical protein
LNIVMLVCSTILALSKGFAGRAFSPVGRISFCALRGTGSIHCFPQERNEKRSGGGKEIRTPDFQLAKLALYQLSYTPAWARSCSKMVGLSGLEPLTSRLSGVCSNHLSYKPVSRLAPRGPCLGGILLRFRLYALVKDSHLAVALVLADLATNG